jgi:predicted transglutaminase-like cysteine proteinase
MFFVARTAQVFSLIVAVIFSHGASTDARPAGFSAAIEAYGDETAGVQVTLENKSESNSEHDSLLQLAMLSPGNGERSEEHAPTNAEPFGLPTMTALPSKVSEKWAELQSRLLTEERTLATCRNDESACSAAGRRFLAIIELARQRQGRALLGRINRAVNLSIRPMSDWAQYGVEDYWATPLETLGSGAGDCEDYAIVKYFVLRESGIVADDLRLLIVHDIKGQTNHAVLAVRNDGNWLILDNRTLVMVNADQALHYYPLFALDQRGVRTFVTAVARR